MESDNIRTCPLNAATVKVFAPDGNTRAYKIGGRMPDRADTIARIEASYPNSTVVLYGRDNLPGCVLCGMPFIAGCGEVAGE